MEDAAVLEVAGDRRARGGVLPLLFGGQARVAPARVGVGLEVADVGDGRVRVERQQAAQRLRVPDAVALLPVQRRLPAALPHGTPALRQPETRGVVAAGIHEREVLPVDHRPIGEPIRAQVNGVARALVVERKAVAFVADAVQAAGLLAPAERACRRTAWQRDRVIGRAKRVDGQVVLDVGEDQLLVLLLVIQAEVQ